METSTDRTITADTIPAGFPDPTGQPATPEQAEASDNAPEGLIYIDARDGDVCEPGSFAYQYASRHSALCKVWVD